MDAMFWEEREWAEAWYRAEEKAYAATEDRRAEAVRVEFPADDRRPFDGPPRMMRCG